MHRQPAHASFARICMCQVSACQKVDQTTQHIACTPGALASALRRRGGLALEDAGAAY